MNKTIYLVFIIVFFSCEKEKTQTISSTPMLPVVISSCHQKWELVSKSVYHNQVLYNSNDVLLCFDTLKHELTISGNKDSVFVKKGTFGYYLKDSTFYQFHPVLNKKVSYTQRLLHINTPSSGFLIYSNTTSNELFITHDFSKDIADDETYLIFKAIP